MKILPSVWRSVHNYLMLTGGGYDWPAMARLSSIPPGMSLILRLYIGVCGTDIQPAWSPDLLPPLALLRQA